MNTDITILRADKGNATVILNTIHYNQKIGALLQDRADRRLAKDRTGTVELKTSLLLHFQSFPNGYVPRAQDRRGFMDCLRCI
jgi:hypothetical protein